MQTADQFHADELVRTQFHQSGVQVPERVQLRRLGGDGVDGYVVGNLGHAAADRAAHRRGVEQEHTNKVVVALVGGVLGVEAADPGRELSACGVSGDDELVWQREGFVARG